MSSNNPFRSRMNTSESTPISREETHLDSTVSSTLHRDGRSPSDDTRSPPSNRDNQDAASRTIDALAEELPPAYTPAPDVRHGETSIEFGPSRPFQQPHRPMVSTVRSTVAPRAHWSAQNEWPPRSWSGFPGALPPHPTPPISHAPILGPPLPPRGTQPATSSLSDFARDFYTAGANVNRDLLGGPSSQYTTLSPPSLPPRPSPVVPPGSPGRGRDAPDADSVEPTTTPVPGRPLLRNGQVLVYPAGFECPKCHNTGYKNYDPTHPHKKCWTKYAKPYKGAMTYASWSSSGDSPSNSQIQLQRPLRSFSPPQSTLHTSRSQHRPSASLSSLEATSTNPRLSRSGTTSRIKSGYPGASAPSQSRVIPVPGGGIPMSPYLDPLQTGSSASAMVNGYQSTPRVIPVGSGVFTRPPPGTAVLEPGDPRLGGRLCWMCGGAGSVSLMLFDQKTCKICGGIGRTF